MRRAVGLGLAGLLLAGSLAGQSVAYEGSLGMATGRYIFTQRTTTWTLTTALAATAGPATFRVALPVWLQNSTAVSASGVGGVGTGGLPSGGSSGGVVGDSGRHGAGGSGGGMPVAAARRRVEVPGSAFTDYQAAIGDPVVSLGLRGRAGAGVALGATALAKVPVADTSGYGTGRWDVGGTVSLSMPLGSRTLVGLDGSYWHLGDLPDLDFRDPVGGTASVSRLLGSRWAGSLYVRGGSSALRGFDPPIAIGGSAFRLGAGGGVGVDLAVGLTETAADLALSGFWRVRLR